MADTSKYYILPADPLHSYCWGDQCVVYHAGSGDTHLLDKNGMDVLNAIGEQPISLDSLSMKFERLWGDQMDQYIEVLLTRFEALGLVEIVENESPN
jgi:PqqD family protein of HPr-rel-A system